MKYCVKYKEDFPYYNLKEVNEIMFKYEEGFFNELVSFLIDNPIFQEKTLILDYSTDETLILEDIQAELRSSYSIIKNLLEKYSNLNIKILFPMDFLLDSFIENNNLNTIEEELRENNICYFFKIFVNNWEILNGLLKHNISDMYITDELCFDLKRVYETIYPHNINVRVFPNVAQSSWETSEPLKKFFLRPEDIEKCNKYINVCEFWNSYQIQDTMTKIYVINKEWKDDLNYIISDLNYNIDARFLHPDFTLNKISCQKKCLQDNRCHLCDVTLELYEKLKKENKPIFPNYNQDNKNDIPYYFDEIEIL